MKGYDASTLTFYGEKADHYVDDHPRDVAGHLPAFLDLLQPGGSILELGCGGGVDAAYMTERGFAVDATDGVAAMAAKAEQRLKRPVPILRFHEIDADARYDAVIATASLLHVPKRDLPDILARIWRALKPGGRHIATYKTGHAEGWDDHRRYYNYPSMEGLEACYKQSGRWAALDIKASMESGFFSGPCRWLTIQVQKQKRREEQI